MAERRDLIQFENIPLDSSSAVVDIIGDGKILEGTKTSIITNTLIEFANESHEDFFLNSKDKFGPFQSCSNILPLSHSNRGVNPQADQRRSQFQRSCARDRDRDAASSSDGDSTPTDEPKIKPKPKLIAPLKKDLSYESGESIDLSRTNSPAPNNNNSFGEMHGHGYLGATGNTYYGVYHERSPSVCSSVCGVNLRTSRTDSVVEELLSDIYDGRWASTSIESDFDGVAGGGAPAFPAISVKRYTQSELMAKDKAELKGIIKELQHRVQQTNSRLLRQLKTRAKKRTLIQTNCNVVTACLQAKSLKREVDAKMKFDLDPQPGAENFSQWCDAIKAANRMSGGVPNSIRRKIWLNLADNYIREIQVDWREIRRSAFNDRSNPDDNELGIQIVKDLHRTGCSTFSGLDNDQERAVLKRVLLGYARWNKEIGYCQGFNIIAALILDVVGRKEEEALKIMIFLIDKVLPASYFSNNLRALSVDMAVFRDLMETYLPNLSGHLGELQVKAQQDLRSGGYEPPLTNVFTMQWFLTLFATCLPLHAVLRIWDAIMIEGSEVIIRTALALWGVLQKKLLKSVNSADDFYTEMAVLLQAIVDQRSNMIDVDSLLERVYSFAPFPFPQLDQLREQYTYNITPIALNEASIATTSKKKASRKNSESADLETMTDLTRVVDAGKSVHSSSLDIEEIGPAVFGDDVGSTPGDCPPGVSAVGGNVMEERTCTNVAKLQRKYEVIRKRQSQAKIMLQRSSVDEEFKKQQQPELGVRSRVTNLVIPPAPTLLGDRGYSVSSSNAVNHLYVKPDETVKRERKNRHVVPYGTTLFARGAEDKQSTSPMRYAGAYFVSNSQAGADATAHAPAEDIADAAPKPDNAASKVEDDSNITTITFSDSENESFATAVEVQTDDNNNNDIDKEDISKTLLQLRIEWKDKHSNGEESSDSSRSISSINHAKNPFSSPSQPVGFGSFTTDDIVRSEKTEKSEAAAATTRVSGEDTDKAAELPAEDATTPAEEKTPSRPKRRHLFPPHVKKEKREFGIKLGIYKASDFAVRPTPVRPMLSHGEGKTERITRQQINNCLTRESLASKTWDT